MCWHLQFETLFERLLLIDGRHILAALRQLLPSQLPNIPHRRFRPRCRQVGRVGHSNLGPIGCEFRSSDRIQPTFSGLLDQTARQLPADLVGLAPQLFVALVHGSEQGREQRVVLVCGIVEKECAVALRWAVPFGRLFGAVAVGRVGDAAAEGAVEERADVVAADGAAGDGDVLVNVSFRLGGRAERSG